MSDGQWSHQLHNGRTKEAPDGRNGTTKVQFMFEAVEHPSCRLHQLQCGNVRILWHFVFAMQRTVMHELRECVVSLVGNCTKYEPIDRDHHQIPNALGLFFSVAAVTILRMRMHAVKIANKFITSFNCVRLMVNLE